MLDLKSRVYLHEGEGSRRLVVEELDRSRVPIANLASEAKGGLLELLLLLGR